MLNTHFTIFKEHKMRKNIKERRTRYDKEETTGSAGL